MQKVIDIKFIRVLWYPNENLSIKDDLDIALYKLNCKISEYLKKGFVMEGDAAYRQFRIPVSFHCVRNHLVQTMIKYED